MHVCIYNIYITDILVFTSKHVRNMTFRVGSRYILKFKKRGLTMTVFIQWKLEGVLLLWYWSVKYCSQREANPNHTAAWPQLSKWESSLKGAGWMIGKWPRCLITYISSFFLFYFSTLLFFTTIHLFKSTGSLTWWAPETLTFCQQMKGSLNNQY